MTTPITPLRTEETHMRTSLTITLLAVALGVPALSPAAPRLQAGAAKVDVTPAERELPPGYEGILDRIYSRAIVIGDGTSLAALISVDAGANRVEGMEFRIANDAPLRQEALKAALAKARDTARATVLLVAEALLEHGDAWIDGGVVRAEKEHAAATGRCPPSLPQAKCVPQAASSSSDALPARYRHGDPPP